VRGSVLSPNCRTNQIFPIAANLKLRPGISREVSAARLIHPSKTPLCFVVQEPHTVGDLSPQHIDPRRS
jgi:hypothetical protein